MMVTLNAVERFLYAVRTYLATTSVEYEQNAHAAALVEKVRYEVFKDVQRAVAPWQ
jgi:hypothetical protein